MATMISGNHDPFLHAGTFQVVRLPRRRGEAETPTSNQSPHGTQGRRLLGPATLRTCPIASLLSQVQVHLGPGGYCRHSGNGGPQTCLSAARLHQPMLQTLARGQASWGGRHKASSGAASPGRIAAEAERSRQEVPRQALVTQSMTTKARRAPARAVSSFPL